VDKSSATAQRHKEVEKGRSQAATLNTANETKQRSGEKPKPNIEDNEVKKQNPKE
jgi:hypothetical protein